METKEIIENNKLIAEFMGYANGRPLTNELLKTLYNDWNSLMPVIEKIESLGFVTELSGNEYHNFFTISHPLRPCNEHIVSIGRTDIPPINKKETTYKAVIEFIKWFNLNK